ncbi:MAG: HAD family hydrolase [Planctomycetota bacterium]|jgi:HAD superfamily hydrolase (TIGR01509 family)
MISTVIFDLDGLLADTEDLHRAAYQKVFAGFDVELSDEQYAYHWIRSGKGTGAFLNERNLAIDPALVRRQKACIYNKLVSEGVNSMPGSRDLLSSLEGHKAMVLATSSYSADARAVLGALGFDTFFPCMVAKDDVEHIKPHPEIFLRAAGKMAAAPEQCIVIEDAEKGVLAAHAAGMKCIAVPNEHTANNDFSKATLVVDSLEQIDRELIDQW